MKLARNLVVAALSMTGALCYGQSAVLDESRETCGALVQRLVNRREPAGALASADCGGVESTALKRELKVTRDIWDSALRRRILFVRCVQPGECVPFLVRLSDLAAPTRVDVRRASPSKSARSNPAASPAHTCVRSGQRVMLIWDRGGIRLTMSVVCLSAGSAGERVRVRVGGGRGTILSAWVVNSLLLRSDS